MSKYIGILCIIAISMLGAPGVGACEENRMNRDTDVTESRETLQGGVIPIQPTEDITQDGGSPAATGTSDDPAATDTRGPALENIAPQGTMNESFQQRLDEKRIGKDYF